MSNQEILNKLETTIAEGDEDSIEGLAGQILEQPDILNEALDVAIGTIKKVGDRFGEGEIFLPEMVLAADTMLKFMEIVEPQLEESAVEAKKTGTVVIGTVKGDIHTIGKDIVVTMLQASGFEVVDLGVNVSPMDIIKNAQQSNAQIIGLSALMTTSMPYQKEVVDLLTELGNRDNFYVAVGGGPVTAEYAEKIGANGWAPDASAAVALCEHLVNSEAPPSTANIIVEEA